MSGEAFTNRKWYRFSFKVRLDNELHFNKNDFITIICFQFISKSSTTMTVIQSELDTELFYEAPGYILQCLGTYSFESRGWASRFHCCDQAWIKRDETSDDYPTSSSLEYIHRYLSNIAGVALHQLELHCFYHETWVDTIGLPWLQSVERIYSFPEPSSPSFHLVFRSDDHGNVNPRWHLTTVLQS